MKCKIVTALAAILAAAATHAQTLDEIVVAAQKCEQSIQDVPSGAAATGEDESARIGAASFEDYYRSLTYVNIQPVADSGGALGTFNYRLRRLTVGVSFKYRF